MNNIIVDVQTKYSFLDNVLTNFWKTWSKSSSAVKYRFKTANWKNSKAKPGCAYVPTELEKFANVMTHGSFIVPSLVAAYELYKRSKSPSQYLVSWIYGISLVLLFLISTFFHCSCYSKHYKKLKNLLHRCDRAMIYIFIAASYFPWLQIENVKHPNVLFILEWGIWLLAILGILYQQIFHERFKCLETCFYIIMGLGPAIVVICIGQEFHAMLELKLGGFFYILGIYFFKSDGLVPMAHAIWHLFVVIAASCHYYAILVYLFPSMT